MTKRGLATIVLLIVLSFLTQAYSCGDNQTVSSTNIERIPALRLVPNIFFEAAPEFESQKTISVLGADPLESFLSNTFLIQGPAYRIHASMAIINESLRDIETVVLIAFVKDPSKFVIGSIAEMLVLGQTFYFNPTPAMIDENEPVYFKEGSAVDPFPGYVGYFPIGPLKAGDGVSFEVRCGAGPETQMHFEAVGLIGEGVWAVPANLTSDVIPGTSIKLTAPQALEDGPTKEIFDSFRFQNKNATWAKNSNEAALQFQSKEKTRE